MPKNKPKKEPQTEIENEIAEPKKQTRQKMDTLYKKISKYTRKDFIEEYNKNLKQCTIKAFAKKLGTTEYLLRTFVKLKFNFTSPTGKSSKCAIPLIEY